MHQVQPRADAPTLPPLRVGTAAGRPVATIVIPAWNAWEHTERCLRSLRPTLGPQDQVVVVDNGSTDGTRESLAAYGWVDVVANDENQGFARGCNQGAAEAAGRVVVFLNSDTDRPVGLARRAPRPVRTGATSVPWVHARTTSRGGRRRWPFPILTTDARRLRRIRRGVADQPPGTDLRDSAVDRILSRRAHVLLSRAGRLRRAVRDRRLRGRRPVPTVRSRADLRLLIAHGSFVHHHGHASFDANDVDWRVTQGENRVRFEEKWGAAALRPPVLLTACLIVKDEEQMLPACLESVRDAVDEIVVYDTGSMRQDRGDRPRRPAPRSCEGEWEDSFAVGAERRTARTPPASGCSPSMPTSDSRPIPTSCGPSSPTLVGRRGLSRCDREPARTGQSALRPHRDPGVPADRGDMAPSPARAGRRRRRPRPAVCGPPTCRVPDLIHHGYIAEVFDDRHKAERNLELAWAALDDERGGSLLRPDEPRPGAGVRRTQRGGGGAPLRGGRVGRRPRSPGAWP